MSRETNISKEQLEIQAEYSQKVKSILSLKYYDRTPKAYIPAMQRRADFKGPKSGFFTPINGVI